MPFQCISLEPSKLFEDHNGQQDAYDECEGLHPNDEQDKEALVKTMKSSSVHSFMDAQQLIHPVVVIFFKCNYFFRSIPALPGTGGAHMRP